jgi:SAM-dependent methyltransferase
VGGRRDFDDKPVVGLPRAELRNLPVEGYLDCYTPELIAGWAWDSDHPEERVFVEILIDGKFVARVAAEEYREDLANNGIGGGTYAYSYRPSSAIDPATQKVAAMVVGSAVALPDLSDVKSLPIVRIPLDWRPIHVEVNADPHKLSVMHDHVNTTWSRLGRADPYWSVLTDPIYKGAAFAEHRQRFFDSGKEAIATFLAFLARSGVSLSQDQVCFELGCGVGRVTAWLSPLFSRIIAADISADHLRIAENVIALRGCTNVVFRQFQNLRDLELTGSFDVFFSLIVFQHNPPPIMAYMLRTILQQLNPGGVGYFQIPTYTAGYSFRVDNYLTQLSAREGMEMHVLPQQHVIDLIYACECTLLEMREDGMTGPNAVSNTFLVQKAGS